MSDQFAQLAAPFDQNEQRTGPHHVAILLATFDGADMLMPQLESIARQTHDDWSLTVSDDGSSDATTAVVRSFAASMPQKRVAIIRGPGRGSAQNFLSLLRAAGRAPFVAFSDQDDVWFDDKLSRAVSQLKNAQLPTVYGSTTVITDKVLMPLRTSLRFKRRTGFQNALVQNVAGGNTMVLNRSALDALQPASKYAEQIISHDWWCYQMVTGMGGRMLYDPVPSLFYRQHSANQIGANDTMTARVLRLQKLAGGQFSKWLDAHFAALFAAEKWLAPEARKTLGLCLDLKSSNVGRRLRAFEASGIYRQTRRGSLALRLAAVAGRL